MEFSLAYWLLCCCFVLCYEDLASAYNVHLRDTVPTGAVILNVSIDGDWDYSFHKPLSSNQGRHLLKVNEHGVVTARQAMNCTRLSKNPFHVYIEATARTHASDNFHKSFNYTLIPLTVTFHGTHCHVRNAKHNSRKALEILPLSGNLQGTELQLVVLNDFPLGACFSQGQSILTLLDFLPSTLTDCDPLFAIADSITEKQFYVDTVTGEISSLQTICLDNESGGEVDLQLIVFVDELCSKNKQGDLEYATKIPLEVVLQRTTDRTESTHNGYLMHESHKAAHRRVRRATRVLNHPPRFFFPEYIETVPEGEDRGYVVTTLTATDQDSGPAGALTYYMHADRDGRSQNMFNIDPQSGLVTTTTVLDRETMDSHYFRVTATDGGIPARTAVTILRVNVEDRNDHSPVFEMSEYQTPVRENVSPGTTIVEVRATDNDVGSNADIRYSITNAEEPNNVFRIDERTGILTTRSNLDREAIEQYILEVQAVDMGTDPGPKSASIQVTIDVLDENDNYPQFSQRSYDVLIPEDITPNTMIESIVATDRDAGTNADIRYSMIGGNSQGHFAIDSFNGQITVISRLDYENINSYRLVIRAQDSGRPPRINSTHVVVSIQDVNDNEPRFPSTLYQTSVREDLGVDSSVINLQAFDADSDAFARLTYSIINPPRQNPFVINENTGLITITRELDRETVPRYDLSVVASDQGDPPKTATAQVSITVMDVNDNPPVFDQREYHTVVDEEARPGTSVLTVTAIDADEESSISYQITAGNTRNHFSIITQMGHGLISVAQRLDYKQDQRYVLSVTASDNSLSDTCLVYINVSDANTHRPVFEQSPYVTSIDENSAPDTTVIVVHATDDDVGENARITYTMDSIPEFQINPDTGAIITRMELDRETKASYTLRVTAQDNGLEPKLDTTDVEITVNDVNDNYPVFTETTYQGEVWEDESAGTSVLRITAEDADEGENKQIKYTFRGGNDGNGDFVIDSSSGVIRTDRRLDREETAVYNLVAFATDKGTPNRRTSIDIVVTVKDVNDNPPNFGKSDLIEVYINENSPIGTLVDTISANDPDEGTNAIVAYSIVGGDEEYFGLDYQSGQLITMAEMNYEERTEYSIRIRATSSPLFSDATVIIHVVDQNDNRPVINDFSIIFNNFEKHFPQEEIGFVPAYDPDVMDHLMYDVPFGNDANLIQVNQSTGAIKLNPNLDTTVQINANMKVSVSDGINRETADLTLNITMVTEDMLFNSVTVRLADITQEEFLSPMYDKFVSALGQIIPCEKKFVYVFNVQDDDVDQGNILNISFSAKPREGSSYYTSKYLQQRVYLNRATLSRISESIVLPFDDNLCLVEPCPNMEECQSILAFGETSGFVQSRTVLFRPVHPVNQYRCVCTVGFSGNFCVTEINQCYSNPCQNGGQCLKTGGGYSCLCPEGFAGINCEENYKDGRCVAGLCRNGGTCFEFANRPGFRCVCPSNDYDGKFCEMSTRHFPPGSFVTFSAIPNRLRLTISLSFVTMSRNALLFYNGRYNEKHDFIGLEIIDGKLQFSFSTGGSTAARVMASIPGGVNDGLWHDVTIDYYAKSATLSIDDCDTAMAVQFGDIIGNYTCASRTTMLEDPDFRFLDLTGPFMLGGLASLPEDFPVRNKEFHGCIRNVYIDYKLLDLNSYVADNGTKPQCESKADYCASNPCENGGTCISGWQEYSCKCQPNYGGPNCQERKPGDIRFSGDGYVKFPGSDSPISLPWRNQLMFRTNAENGMLMIVGPGSYATVNIEIIDGYVQYKFSSEVARISDVTVNDGEWHTLVGEWKNEQIVLSLDHGKYEATIDVADDYITGLKVNFVTLGGEPNEESETGFENGFVGCIQGAQVGLDYVIGDPEDDDESDVWFGGARPGCNEGDLCMANSCPADGQCVSDWDSFRCECNAGYYGKDCIHACDESLNPCRHRSACERQDSASHGYTCQCSELYYGNYCENRVDDQPCPDGWWGYPICGPCTCDTDLGYDDRCNKTTGECYCEPHSYKPSDSNMCHPCNCYLDGSYSKDCDQETGQCQCRRGVIGRRCDSCRDPFAEVTLKGCEVIYQACPKNYAGNMWWPQTLFGKKARESCPIGSFGLAERQCFKETGWAEPDLFNCTSNTFGVLATMLSELERGDEELSNEVAKKIASELQYATSETPEFYGNDVNVAYKIMIHVLKYECQQKGIELTSRQDILFTKNLMESTSILLDPVNELHWRAIQDKVDDRGTAELMKHLELYGENLARNMDISYTEPFAMVMKNIIFSLDVVVRENFQGTAIPKYEGGLFTIKVEDSTQIHLPSDIVSPKPTVPTDNPSIKNNVAVTSWMTFPSIGLLLPRSYDDNTVKVHDKLELNSAVVSLALYDALAENRTGDLPTPIAIDFELNTAINRSDPQCVYWDFNLNPDGGGSWSTAGCQMVHHNKTSNRVNCSCNHLTHFAVLMDVSATPVALTDKMALRLITYVGISISLLALLLSFFTFACLPNLRSNTNSIHINLVISLFIAELIFLLGIDTTIDLACKMVAIGLHYFFMATFAWMFVEGLHLYRMLTEVKNINRGQMKFYYVVGWGLPLVIVSLAVGLSEDKYGKQINQNGRHFCWLSTEDTLIWSFAGPVLIVVGMNLIVFFMAVKATIQSRSKDPEFSTLKSGLKAAAVLLPLLGTTWVFGILAVNQDIVMFHYLFAIFNCLQGLFIFLFHCCFNEKARLGWQQKWARMRGKKGPLDTTYAAETTFMRSALAYSSRDGTPARFNIGTSTGSTGSSRTTSKTSTSNLYRPDGYIRNTSTSTTSPPSAPDYAAPAYRGYDFNNLKPKPDDPDTGEADPKNVRLLGTHESDTESDLSVGREQDNMSLASSHSSDEEDEGGGKRRADWRKMPNKMKNEQLNAVQNVQPTMHSTPKVEDTEWYYGSGKTYQPPWLANKGVNTAPDDSPVKKSRWPGETFSTTASESEANPKPRPGILKKMTHQPKEINGERGSSRQLNDLNRTYNTNTSASNLSTSNLSHTSTNHKPAVNGSSRNIIPLPIPERVDSLPEHSNLPSYNDLHHNKYRGNHGNHQSHSSLASSSTSIPQPSNLAKLQTVPGSDQIAVQVLRPNGNVSDSENSSNETSV